MQRAPRRHGRRRNRIGMRRHQDLRQPGAPLSATLSGLGSIGPRLPDSQEGSLSPGISVDSKLSGLEGSRRNRHRMDRSIDFELYWIESVHDGLEVLPKAHGLLQQDHQIEIALAMLLAACSRAEQHDSLQPVPQGCLESGSDLSANSLWKHPYTSKRHCRPVANRAPDLRYRWPPWRKPQRRRSSSSSKIGRRPGGGGTPRPWRKWSPRMPSSGRTAHPPCRDANPWPPHGRLLRDLRDPPGLRAPGDRRLRRPGLRPRDGDQSGRPARRLPADGDPPARLFHPLPRPGRCLEVRSWDDEQTPGRGIITPMDRFARYSWTTLAFTLAVILWGATVRATGSGAGCGSHWPLCNGEVVPRSPRIETVIELTHRVTSGIALLLVIGLVVLAFRWRPRGHAARKAAGWTLFFMLTEAAVGAGLVLFELVADNQSIARALFMATHLINTFFLLGAMTLTAHFASGRAPFRLRGQGSLAGWLMAGAAT